MGKKLFFIIALIVAIAITTVVFKNDIKNFAATDSSIGSLKHDIQAIQDRISTPDPLRLEGLITSDSRLTNSGVVTETNKQRQQNNLPALTVSAKLSQSAELKIDDMFKRQYFEHISPTGEGPDALAAKVHYSFIIIGENLALGNFKDDAELLQGWMNSPGHRANILRTGYKEIGVAVRKGMFEGKSTWLAVQEFGTPSAVCPPTDSKLGAQLDADKAELNRQEVVIQQKKRELDAYEPKQGSGYNTKVNEYNNLIQHYNALIAKVKQEVGEYNTEAENYNECLKTYSAK